MGKNLHIKSLNVKYILSFFLNQKKSMQNKPFFFRFSFNVIISLIINEEVNFNKILQKGGQIEG